MRSIAHLLLPLTLALCQCADAADAEKPLLIKDVPHVSQEPDFCGEACAAMYLRSLGHYVGQDYVFNQSGLDPIHGRGCYTHELVKALRKIGFKTGDVWYKVKVEKKDKGLAAQWKALLSDLKEDTGSIVCMRAAKGKDAEHFRLILGFDPKKNEIIYHEPADADGAYLRMKRKDFLELWPLKYSEETWTIVRIRLERGNIRIEPEPEGFTNADFARHMMELKKKVPATGFTIVLEPPFVVVGDGPEKNVRARAENTVRWAVNLLRKDYFQKDPEDILDIWLFRDKASYMKHNREIFHCTPGTPFGYYSDHHKALVMNIATGGGTLVHEIVHPFVHSNFPECPSWFNEGLASLYEQCGERDGHIKGFTNWRLRGLQDAIRNDRVPSFEGLMKTSTHQFYNMDSGTNYGQARYLCYYLQQKGLIRKYYREFRRNCKEDPGGIETLKKVLESDDLSEFKEQWQEFVLTLHFP